MTKIFNLVYQKNLIWSIKKVYQKYLIWYRQHGYDLPILVITLLLLMLGSLMIYSASAPLSERLYGSSLIFLRAHFFHMGVGLVAMLLVMRVSYHRVRAWIPLGLLVTFLLLVMVLIPGIGYESGGASRWLRFGPLGFQPVELLKLILVLHMASYLDRRPERVTLFLRGIAPNLILASLFLLLVLRQPDFGNMVLIALVLMLMVFAGGGKPGHLLLGMAALGALGTWLIFQQSYRLRRLLAFLDPWSDRLDSGFQIIQSYLALGGGGWFGRGLGNSQQKMFFLPDAHTDFIFSIMGEELGLLGVWLVIALFVFLLWRVFRLALRTADGFGRHLAYGIACLFSLQIWINMAVVMGLIPTKGLPLPLLSYGGSAITFHLLATGLLLSISRYGNQPPIDPFDEKCKHMTG